MDVCGEHGFLVHSQREWQQLDDVVSIEAGGHLTYTVKGLVKADAYGKMLNTMTIALLENYVDTQPADNSATDTTVVWGKINLPIVKK